MKKPSGLRVFCAGSGVAAMAGILTCLVFPPFRGEAQKETGSTQGISRAIAIKKSVFPTEAIEIVRFQGADSNDFLKEFGIEVKNVGEIPIYYLAIAIARKESQVANSGGLTLEYGSRRLLRIGSLARSDDLSIKPGESVLLKVRPDEIKGYEAAIKEGKWPRHAFDTIFIWFQLLNYGDGTGYELNSRIDKRPKSE